MKYFLFITLFLSSISMFSQRDIKITTQQSEIFKDKKKHTELLFSEGDEAGGFVTVRAYYGGFARTVKGYYINHYDKELKLKNAFDLAVENTQLKGISIKDGNLYLLQSELDKKADEYRFNVLQTPLSDFNFQTKTLLSLSEDDIKKYFGIVLGVFFFDNGWNQADSNSMGEVTFSKNKNFFSIIWDIKDKEKQTQRVYVFDSNFEKVFQKDFTRNIKDRLFEYENIDVDDETGEVYLLGKVFENNSRATKKKGKVNYHYELHKISPNEEQSVSFKTDNHFVSSLTALRSDNTIVCGGFYSERNESRFKGVSHFTIDPSTFEIKSKKFTPFSDSFLTEKYGKAKDKELRNLDYQSVFLDGEGNFIINAEEFYITQHTSTGMNGSSNTYTSFHYNDIVSVKINPSGDVLWARNINKRQRSSGGVRHLSFSATVKNDDTYLFINCSDKVRKLRNDRIEFKQTKAKKSNLYAIKIDSQGNYSYQSIVDDKESEVTFFVSQGIPTSANGNEMVFLGRKKSKKQFLKINIQ